MLPEAPQNPDLPHGVGERILGFQRLIESYRVRLGTEPLAELMTDLLRVIDYKAELARVYREATEAQSRWETIEGLVSSAALYEQRAENPSLLGFLEETALTGREDDRTDDRRELHAVTPHLALG